ncbi:hypothetical protein N0V85_006146 [Neurospora sp. IMI 360204]|nr:hypothetical protein N0V85_006146 [Neurospora sp. IMI 360204]
MFWSLLFAVFATLLRSGRPSTSSLKNFEVTDNAPVSAAESVAVYDSETGLTYSQNFALYKADGRGITFRIAISSDVSSNSAYDAVVQVIVPNDVGWAGLAWGGTMTKNPLMVFWRGSNNKPVLSSRWAR